MFHHALHTRLKLLSSIAALLFFVTNAACQPAAPKQMEAEKFNSLKEAVVQAGNVLAGYRAEDVYTEADRLYRQFKGLYEKVRQAKDIDPITPDIETNIRDMASVYRKLATLEPDVMVTFNKERSVLTSTHGTTGDIAKSTDAQITYYQGTIAQLEKAVQSETDATERRKKEITIGGHKSIINSLRAKKVVWEKLSQHQQELLEAANTHRKNIEILFHTLRTNAAVYEEAADAIRMRLIVVGSLGNLIGKDNIEALITNLLNTQIEIDAIVAKVAEADFNFEPKQARPGM